jgi:Skp family chaperone for outer membrane proteins
MKKLLFVCVVLAASLLFSNSTNAQVKIGYFDEQSLLSLFPDIQKIDTIINSYVKDSLNPEYAYTVQDYQRRDSLFKKDSATMPAKARELALSDLNRLGYKLANWQQYAQEMQNGKMEQALLPYRQKMLAALQQIIAEQKYTMVLKSETLSPYMEHNILDNLTIRVAMKLNLPLPQQIMDAWKQAGGTLPAPAKTAAPVKKG